MLYYLMGKSAGEGIGGSGGCLMYGIDSSGSGLLGLDHKVIPQPHAAEVTGLLDDLQRLGPEDPVLVGFEECAYAAPAQAKSHISLIHLCYLL